MTFAQSKRGHPRWKQSPLFPRSPVHDPQTTPTEDSSQFTRVFRAFGDNMAHVTANGAVAPGGMVPNRHSHRNLTTLRDAVQLLAAQVREPEGEDR